MSLLTSVSGRLRSAREVVAGSVADRWPRPGSYDDGVTIVTVTWNSLPYLRALVATVQKLSPEARILVVDNGSRDDTREWLRSLPGDRLEILTLPTNFGHGVALDLALGRVRTKYLVTLDVDAFPVSSRWLAEPLAALGEPEVLLAGALWFRDYVHPCFLATRTEWMHQNRLSFRCVGQFDRLDRRHPIWLDVAEGLSVRARRIGGPAAFRFYEVTEARGPTYLDGSVFGGLVYHHGKGTRDNTTSRLEEWYDAIQTYHPDLAIEVTS
jgi:glycosyltransferase involved in cell wall biosynthesis